MIPGLKRLRPEDGEFRVSVGYLVKCCFKGKKTNNWRYYDSSVREMLGEYEPV